MSAPSPPPMPQAFHAAGGAIGLDADTLASAQSQLMQLIPLFEETKQFLKKVQTDDKSTPRIESEAGGDGGGGELAARLAEAEQDIRLMTATMRQLQAENAALRQKANASDARKAAAANMVSAMVELRSSLRGMGDATEAWLALADDDGPEEAVAQAAAPLPPMLRATARKPAAPKTDVSTCAICATTRFPGIYMTDCL